MGQVNNFLREPHQATAKILTYNEQFTSAKIDSMKRSAKEIVIYVNNAEFVEQIEKTKTNANNLNANDKIFIANSRGKTQIF